MAQIKYTIHRYVSKYPCPVLDMSHHHSVLTDIKEKELSKLAHIHTWYYSITKNHKWTMNHHKIPYFIRKKQHKCSKYRKLHVFYASFQNQFQNSGKCCSVFQHISPIRQLLWNQKVVELLLQIQLTGAKHVLNFYTKLQHNISLNY